MARFGITDALLALLCLSGGLFAQSSGDYPRVTITLPVDSFSEKLAIEYVLYGRFGAYGGYVTPKEGAASYEIRTSVEGNAAEQIKMFVWMAGCKMSTFDIPLQEHSRVEKLFSCVPLPTVPLVGRIHPFSVPGEKAIVVWVNYSAHWACRFFGLMDCMVPQVPLGTAKLDPDGYFEIDIPDFSADSVATNSEGGAELRLILRETETWNPIAALEPESEGSTNR